MAAGIAEEQSRALEICPPDQAGPVDEIGFRHVLSTCLDFGESSGPFQAPILAPYPLLAEKMQPVRNPPVNRAEKGNEPAQVTKGV